MTGERYVATTGIKAVMKGRETEVLDALNIPWRSGNARRQAMTATCLRRFAPIDFGAIGRAALARLPDLLGRWLPGGRVRGIEYVALNPCRADRRVGSFKVNLKTGRWADFATGDKGGDVVSLAAYLAGISQVEAAKRLASMLGIGARDAG